jgi:glycosyltransferase involved in cell wall biosynthesis
LVDDGSPDPIGDIIGSYHCEKLKYFNIENSGPANARNFAAEQSSGEYVAFLNHDDLWAPEKLAEQLEMVERTGAVWVASGSQRINFYTNVVLERHQGKDYFKDVFYDILEKKHLWAFSTVMVRKDVFFEVGMFNGDIWFMDDRDLYLRIAKQHPLAYISKVHLFDRVHTSNITSTISMERMLGVHETLINNARKLDGQIPDKVINNSRRMIYRTACIEYLRANDIPNMRKMLKNLRFNVGNYKFIPYRILALFDDVKVLAIMKKYRALRQKINQSKVYPTANQ